MTHSEVRQKCIVSLHTNAATHVRIDLRDDPATIEVRGLVFFGCELIDVRQLLAIYLAKLFGSERKLAAQETKLTEHACDPIQNVLGLDICVPTELQLDALADAVGANYLRDLLKKFVGGSHTLSL
jgi:hypothetical protein